MKTHTQGFENEIKTMGRQQSVLISFNDETLTGEDVNSVTFTYEGALLKSIMKELIIDSNEPIAVETQINFKYGLLVNGDYEYLDYGNFVVYEVQKKEDTSSYEIKCYDKMLYAMQEYEPISMTYPTTIMLYLTKICERLGFALQYPPTTNMNLPMPSDLYIDIGYTYRDVLDDIAEVLGCSLYVKDTGTPILVVAKPNTTAKTLDEEWFKDINVNFGEKFGPVNAIVLSRSAESDNVYLRDEESITANGLTEIKIVDNQIMNFNNRSDYLQGIADSLFGLEYYLNDYSSTGIMFLDFMDVYSVTIGENTYTCLMLNDEQNITQGLEENIYAERPEQNETDYTKADKTDQRINQTYLIVDKQNQTIESVISNVTEQNQKLVVMQQSINEIDAKISDLADITISDSTSTGTLTMDNINESEPIKIEVHPTGTNISELIASEATIIGENTIIRSRTIRFTNTTTNEVFNYVLPDDLFYYDAENYDTFTLEYEGQICQVEKKCKLENGQVVLLQTPVITDYPYPSIELTTGDYTIELVGYIGYIFARLMCTNIYTEQFATHVEVESEINQKADEITASVSQTLTNYVTTTQMTSAINVAKNEINLSVEEVNTKAVVAQNTADGIAYDLSTNYYTIAQTNSAINQKADSITSSVSQTYSTKTETTQAKNEAITSANNTTDTKLENYSTTTEMNSVITQTANSINSVVSTKVGNNEIISKINQSAEAITIDANKININGTISANGNFKVDTAGNMEATSATLTNALIKSSSNDSSITLDNGTIITKDDDGNRGVEIVRQGINIYSYNDANNFIGALKSATTSDNYQVLELYADSGDGLYFGVKQENSDSIDTYIALNYMNSGKVAFARDIRIDYGRSISFYDDNSLQAEIYLSTGKRIVVEKLYAQAPVFGFDLTGNHYEGTPVISNRSPHVIFIEWNNQLNFYVDATYVGTLSDRRLKKDITELDNNLVRAIAECEVYQFRADNKKDVISAGIMAQDFQEKCKKYGIKAEDYGVFKKIKYNLNDNTEYYAIDYEQYLIIKNKYLEDKLKEQEERLNRLEELINGIYKTNVDK